MCQFTYYKEEEKGTYYPQLYCHITNGFCLYRKKCLQEGKFILIDGESWKDCYIMNDYLFKQEAPKGAYKVVTYKIKKNGNVELYVRLNDETTIKIDSPNNEILEYVYLEKVGNEYKAYVEKPKVEKKETTKKVTNKKKK
jgi:hypothetical protein